MLTYRRLLRFTFAILAIAAGACTSTVSAGGAREVSVCELHATLATPPPDRLRVKAVLYAGPRHGTILTDARCPGKSVGVRFADSIPPGSNLSRFEKALTGDVMDLSLRAFEVQVSGVIRPAGPNVPKALLVIDRVDSFKRLAAAETSP